tara:strand:+ start:12 stop:416 length:405 start_codon:yes stop_codon:yes gene_type:complete
MKHKIRPQVFSRRLSLDSTALAIRAGVLKFSKRITVPCIHVDQIRTAIKVFRELADQLEAILKRNKDPNSTKCFMAQSALMMAHARLEKQWVDPRHKYETGERTDMTNDGTDYDTRGKEEIKHMLRNPATKWTD